MRDVEAAGVHVRARLPRQRGARRAAAASRARCEALFDQLSWPGRRGAAEAGILERDAAGEVVDYVAGMTDRFAAWPASSELASGEEARLLDDGLDDNRRLAMAQVLPRIEPRARPSTPPIMVEIVSAHTDLRRVRRSVLGSLPVPRRAFAESFSVQAHREALLLLRMWGRGRPVQASSRRRRGSAFAGGRRAGWPSATGSSSTASEEDPRAEARRHESAVPGSGRLLERTRVVLTPPISVESPRRQSESERAT